MESQKKLIEYDKKGMIYCTDYSIHDIAYHNTSEFINHISDIEMELAISDCKGTGEDYRNDRLYKKYKRFKDTQMISKKELDKLFESYSYDYVVNYYSDQQEVSIV